MAELLISKGVDANAKTRDGMTPMSLAKEKGYAESIAVLREHGAREEQPEQTRVNARPFSALDVDVT